MQQLLTSRFGIAFSLLALLGLYSVWDKSSNYYPVEARVQSIESLCYMKKVDRGVLRKSTTRTEKYPCDMIRKSAATDPEYEDYTVHEDVSAEVIYQAAGENQLRTGKLTLRRTAQRGETIGILVHNDKPDKIRLD